jgi:hypothetical protein
MNWTRIACFFASTILLCTPLHAQESFWSSADAYLGQPHPIDMPKVFAPGLMTDDGTFIMGRIAFSSDGREIYYVQSDSWDSSAHAKIKTMKYTKHRWSKPAVVNEQFFQPTLSIDGNTLYFRKGNVAGNNMNNVWQSYRTGDGWSPPSPLLEKVFGVYDFMPTASGNYYVGSDPSPEDVKNGSTYVYSLLTFSNGDVSVKSLGRPLNGPGFNGDFFIAPDESYMIVSANETKDYEGELYISFRKPDLTWTVPVSLGSAINNGQAHRWGQYVSLDQKYLFFTQGTSEKDCAVYWVRFDTLLEKLRPK